MQKLIDQARLDAEFEAASKRKRTRAPELAAALAGPAGKAKVSLAELHELLSTASAETATAMRHVVRNAEAALARLEERLGQLERDALVFAGGWDPSKTYAANDLVQRGGALFLALVATKAGDMPGSSASFRKIAESKA